jgi:hypothetical protein
VKTKKPVNTTIYRLLTSLEKILVVLEIKLSNQFVEDFIAFVNN